ncbi:MAG TPA: 1,4-alpha-glucan branching protein domain-containing protein, partial [Bacillota bacterium]|nr:1,4-alpha-glucan branching protein domain-containing protein [Bacillota bacterium]
MATMYYEKFREFRDRYTTHYQGNLLKAFRDLMEAGNLELITCAGTHGFLPLMLTDEAVYAQVKAGIDQFEQYFGRKPGGMWLPECGYRPGLDAVLKELGVKYYILDTHGITQAIPTPGNGVHNPVSPHPGVSAFGRDPDSALQVWSSKTGYPGEYAYREYYRDIGWDLPWEYMKPFMHPGGFRHNTGIKYHRVTGPGDHKELYDPERAEQKVGLQATHFVENRQKQISQLSGETELPPIVVCPYDAELFGHWWFEGPLWLEYVIRKSVFDQDDYKLVSPAQYLEACGSGNRVNLAISSWGEEGYNKVWLNPSNDWIYPHLHQAEVQMLELVNSFTQPDELQQRALKQAGRELLLAQSSDWAFIIYMDTTVEYAKRRFFTHLDNFREIYQALRRGEVSQDLLGPLEMADPIFPSLDISCWRTRNVISLPSGAGKRNILMLSWEFPPKTVGGLARHVYDLSRALVRQGETVHVITAEVGNSPALEIVDGVVVHRVAVLGDEKGDFLNWVFYLNQAMLEYGCRLNSMLGGFDLVHAHDWLVAYCGEALKETLGIPLIATIHATEHGRNHGIHNELQYRIHQVEKNFTRNSDAVICCSNYMADEICQGLGLYREKLRVIPNGVEIEAVVTDGANPAYIEKYAPNGEKLILFVGRLVLEKGVQVLLQALNIVNQQYPGFKCIIAGEVLFHLMYPVLQLIENSMITP